MWNIAMQIRMQYPRSWVDTMLKRIALHRCINQDKSTGSHLRKMRACSIDHELLAIIGHGHTEVIRNGFMEVQSRSPTKCSSQLFAYLQFS
jgi:hypothetical protein